ncbi:hypothetical protein [Salinisphaera sp. Q1T1-3]|uniref:hypothetical protein n=1 Tax=Salinisphaera sp. Q1T1-3 TaxID=2321229 RepID=UPI0011C36165|nr:hypothetical protein [Salinisphaera sp. Q1T1-3]
MSVEESKRRAREQRDVVEHVLAAYIERHGHPCEWPEFAFWASKPHGDGMDTLQNALVLAALRLDCFSEPGPDTGGLELEERVVCKKCEKAWTHTSVEITMLANCERLIPAAGAVSDMRYKGNAWRPCIMGYGFFKPENIHSEILKKWTRFMRKSNGK